MIKRTKQSYLTEGLRFSRLNEELMDGIESFIKSIGKCDVSEIYRAFKINPINNNSKGVKELMILKFMGKVDVDQSDHMWYHISQQKFQKVVGK